MQTQQQQWLPHLSKQRGETAELAGWQRGQGATLSSPRATEDGLLTGSGGGQLVSGSTKLSPGTGSEQQSQKH